MSWTPRKFKISKTDEGARIELDIDVSQEEIEALAQYHWIEDCPMISHLFLLASEHLKGIER